jgi:hypothetical protein
VVAPNVKLNKLLVPPFGFESDTRVGADVAIRDPGRPPTLEYNSKVVDTVAGRLA